ncbi:hypothetical protein LEP3755_40910 [Leptolyngbya sp. NIES-3755]|nr:hypothetical protein LEP3755_40910 [Leptolyngbya sp. NIES-3755]
MDDEQDQLFENALEAWDFLSNTYRQIDPEWEYGIRAILVNLETIVEANPYHLQARELRIWILGEGLRTPVEAFREADELVRYAPENPKYHNLRERMRQLAKPYDPDEVPDE